MEFRQIEVFRVVAEELNFGRAAARLGYAQSSVSARVRSLERELGVPLFDRLGRKIMLTEAGRVLLENSEKLLELAEATRMAVIDAAANSEEITGSLTIGAPEMLLTYRLPRLLALFRARHPKVRLSLRPSIGKLTGRSHRIVEEEKLDVAFVLSERDVEATGLSVEPVAEEAISVIAPISHPLATSSLVNPADLQHETLLLTKMPETGCAFRGLFECQLSAVGALPSETMEFTSIEAVKECVTAGMGISVLPKIMVDAELEAGRLAALAWSEPFEVLTQMVWHKKRWKSPALRAFLDTAREVFSVATVPIP